MAQTLASLSLEPLLKLDRMHLGVLSARVAAVPEVSGVAVLTLDDQVLALSGELTSPRYTETVVFDDSAVGYVRVALNPHAFQSGLLSGSRLAGLLLVMTLAPLLVAMGVALQRAWPERPRHREAAADAPAANGHPAASSCHAAALGMGPPCGHACPADQACASRSGFGTALLASGTVGMVEAQ